jgi:DNA-binding transcriptional ArsR family regulator
MTGGKRLIRKLSPMSRVISAVAHVNRLAIINLLLDQSSLDVWEIVRSLRLSDEVVSHHLKILKQSGWITRIRIGKHVTYKLDQKNTREIGKFFNHKKFE